MSFTQTYSRSHLQTLSGRPKRDAIKYYIEGEITDNLLKAARQGKTSYFHIEDTSMTYNRIYQVTLSREDMLDALHVKFPECTISYQENWVDTKVGVRELKKGVMIDWS